MVAGNQTYAVLEDIHEDYRYCAHGEISSARLDRLLQVRSTCTIRHDHASEENNFVLNIWSVPAEMFMDAALGISGQLCNP